MPIFQCNGCPSGPCTLLNMDPEFECCEDCPRYSPGHKNVIAVWREMRAVE